MKSRRTALFRSGIYRKMTAAFLTLIVFCTVSLTAIFYLQSRSVITQKSAGYMVDVIESISTEIDTLVGEVNQAAKIIFADADVKNMADWQAGANLSLEEVQRVNRVQTLLSNVISSKRGIHSILLYNTQGEVMKGQFTDAPVIDAERLTDDGWYEAHPDKLRYFPGGGTKLVQLCRQVKNTTQFEKIGYIQFNLDRSVMTRSLTNRMARLNGNLYVVDGSGEMIANVETSAELPEFEELGLPAMEEDGYRLETIGGVDYVVASQDSRVTGWQCFCIVPMSAITKELQTVLPTSIVIGVILSLAAVALALAVTYPIVTPIIEVANGMKQFEKGDFKVRIEYQSRDEIGYLADSFNRAIGEIDRLVNRVYALQLTEKEYEIKMLQAQMNPHFLYNTLDTINYIAAENNVPVISEMVIALSGLTRSTITKKGPLVTLAEDLQLAEEYLTINKVRFGDRLHVDYDIDPDALRYPIPKLTLQPIIENAIQHGLKQKPDDWLIEISATVEAGRVRVAVSDNGVGMSPALLQRVRERECTEDQTHTRLGIEYLEKRLALIFEGEASLTIESREGEGTRVTVLLPAKLQPPAEPEKSP